MKDYVNIYSVPKINTHVLHKTYTRIMNTYMREINIVEERVGEKEREIDWPIWEDVERERGTKTLKGREMIIYI